MEHSEDILLAIGLHSFGQFMSYPWGYSGEGPEDEEELVSTL